MLKKSSKQITTSYDLFDFISLFSITTDYETTEYKILGLPIWKTKKIKNKNTGEFKTRYYLCGIPLTEVCDKYEEDDAEDF